MEGDFVFKLESAVRFLMSSIGHTFHPTEKQLIMDYLGRKLGQTPCERSFVDIFIREANVYAGHPEEVIGQFQEQTYLPFVKEWYFFTEMSDDGTTARSSRTVGPRDSEKGHWRASSVRKDVVDENGVVIGHTAKMQYFILNGKRETKTQWLMEEYRRRGSHLAICKIYKSPRAGGAEEAVPVENAVDMATPQLAPTLVPSPAPTTSTSPVPSPTPSEPTVEYTDMPLFPTTAPQPSSPPPWYYELTVYDIMKDIPWEDPQDPMNWEPF